MDLVIVLMLTFTLLTLFILAWLPKVGVNSQIVFSVFGLGFAFVLALLISSVTITEVAPYPESQNTTVTATTVNYVGMNQSAYYPNSSVVTRSTVMVSSPVSWVTYTLPYTWLLTYLYYGLGAGLFLRFIGLIFLAMGKAVTEQYDGGE